LNIWNIIFPSKQVYFVHPTSLFCNFHQDLFYEHIIHSNLIKGHSIFVSFILCSNIKLPIWFMAIILTIEPMFHNYIWRMWTNFQTLSYSLKKIKFGEVLLFQTLSKKFKMPWGSNSLQSEKSLANVWDSLLCITPMGLSLNLRTFFQCTSLFMV